MVDSGSQESHSLSLLEFVLWVIAPSQADTQWKHALSPLQPGALSEGKTGRQPMRSPVSAGGHSMEQEAVVFQTQHGASNFSSRKRTQ